MSLSNFFIFFAGILGVSGLILDAIGAHALSHLLLGHPSVDKMMASWQTAVRYQLMHALFLLILVPLSAYIGTNWRAASGFCIVAGLFLFCGSIYLKTLTAVDSLTRLAPVGGVLLMLGWLIIGVSVFFKSSHGP